MEVRNCQITGYGTFLPEQVVTFGEQQRYRVEEGTSQLDMLSAASQRAIEKSGLDVDEIDCFIAAPAVGVQPIPSTAALLHERVAPETNAFSFDVNSTCTSFITALNMASYMVHASSYKNVLIASGDVGSRFLNPKQRESYELFSDAAAAVVLSSTDKKSQGVLASIERTWPQHAHDTEIRGGLTAFPPERYSDNPEEYLFDMDGITALRGIARVVPSLFSEFYSASGLEVNDFDVVIPHQASPALSLVMKKLAIPEGKYVDRVQSHGNMVSASVPFILNSLLEEGRLKAGDKALLCGTAAGLTVNILALEV